MTKVKALAYARNTFAQVPSSVEDKVTALTAQLVQKRQTLKDVRSLLESARLECVSSEMNARLQRAFTLIDEELGRGNPS